MMGPPLPLPPPLPPLPPDGALGAGAAGVGVGVGAGARRVGVTVLRSGSRGRGEGGQCGRPGGNRDGRGGHVHRRDDGGAGGLARTRTVRHRVGDREPRDGRDDESDYASWAHVHFFCGLCEPGRRQRSTRLKFPRTTS